MNKIAKLAVGTIAAVGAIGAIATPASAGSPVPPEGVEKYDCMLSLPLLDQANPLFLGAVACNGKKEEAKKDEGKPGNSEHAPGQNQPGGPGNSENAPGQNQ